MNEYRLGLLAFGAHPDDVELSCGGIMIKMAVAGHKTGIIDMTRGELSSNGDLDTRLAETQAASKVLRLAVRENLGFPDGWLGSSHFIGNDDDRKRSALVALVDCLRRLRPELVLVPFDRERHPDHEAASDLVTKAVFFSGVRKFEAPSGEAHFTPRQVLYYQMRYNFHPTFLLDISDVAHLKWEALQCYSSQVNRPIDSAVHQGTLINSPILMSFLDARDRYYGGMIGVSHAEPFFMRNAIEIGDPVDFFRKHTLGPSHQFNPAL